MSTTLLRTSSIRSVLRAGASGNSKKAGIAGVSFVRGKATLPDLPCVSKSLHSVQQNPIEATGAHSRCQ